MPDNHGLQVTEFQRPSNDKTVQIYDAPNEIVDRAQLLAEVGIELCCDVFPTDAARVYLYDSKDDAILFSRRINHYVIADVAMSQLIQDFDLRMYL